jgi:hypothetical protein
MEEKLRFVFEYEQRHRSMRELCARYEISRRYREMGLGGLVERSRAAMRHQNQTSAEIEEMVLELREAHMSGGRGS